MRTFPALGSLVTLLLLTACSDVSVPPSAAAAPPAKTTWMSPAAKSAKYLLYASDEYADDVYVYDYTNGKQVGFLTNTFGEPGGQCVDAKGDVYITNFYIGTVIEYAHGGSSPLRTLRTGNFPDGCAVDRKGDLAVSDYMGYNGVSKYGAICVWQSGSGPNCYQNDSCAYTWPPAYDDKGNLFVVGLSEQNQAEVCGLLSGSSQMVELSFRGQIYYPGGSVWDGKHIALGDTDANGQDETAMYQVTLSGGSTLTQVGETVLTDASCGKADIMQPFVVGEKNTPANRKQGRIVIGGNLSCATSNLLDFWHYPKGGNPYKTYGLGFVPAGESVSIVK